MIYKKTVWFIGVSLTVCSAVAAASGYKTFGCKNGINIVREGLGNEQVFIQKSGGMDSENPFTATSYAKGEQSTEIKGVEVELLKTSEFDSYTETDWGMGSPVRSDVTVYATKLRLKAEEPIGVALNRGLVARVNELVVYTMCEEVLHSAAFGGVE